MKVRNITNNNGNKVANQFILEGYESFGKAGEPMSTVQVEIFQSYNSAIAKKVFHHGDTVITLDATYWNYSVTTSKYRNQFLGESTKETQAKIDSGEYLLADLNL